MATKDQKARQRASKKAEGGRQISAQLGADEAALLDEVKAKFPGLSQKDVLVAGLRALEGRNQPTPEELVELVAAGLGVKLKGK